MVSPERLDLMQRQWVRLMDGLGVCPSAAYPVFDRLVEAHSEPHRHYHTLEHLGEMFKVVGRLAPTLTDPIAVSLAVWFHDAVYEPRRTDNEERSAAVAADLLGPLGLPADTVGRVGGLVLATAHLSSDDPPADGDTAALLDADLAILGSSEVRYRRYAADIRNEYDWVSAEEYRAGRRAVLERFLGRKRIYHTAMLYAEGEETARTNLRAELASL